SGNRFPMIPYADFVLRGYRLDGPDRWEQEIPEALRPSLRRGVALALGGINDHVGGGFHRYTVDPTWTVPHFEKMLYDNGQIVGFLANLWSAGAQDPAIRSGIFGAIDWLQREMTAPEGGFYAAQDADSFTDSAAAEPEEGAFYVWGWDELEALLEPEGLSALAEAFTVSVPGNFEGVNVLQRRSGGALPDRVLGLLDRLFAARYGAARSALAQFPPARNATEAKTVAWPGRIPAVTDTKAIAAWNGLMVAGLARVAAVFQDAATYRLAARAATWLRDHHWVGDRFHRLNYEGAPAVAAQAEDYAEVIHGLLELHQAATALVATGGADLDEAQAWLDLAIRLQGDFDRHLWDNEAGGYFNADDRPDLIVRERSIIDNATPAANGTALGNLVRLALLTEDLAYLDRAEQGFRAFYSTLAEHPRACPSLLAALDQFQRPVLVRAGADTIAHLAQYYLPTTVLRLDRQLPPGAIALVCQGLTCLPAATTRDRLWDLLKQCQA
ncbi:MAG TPA: thioredoxin domain-containing protein, partial [Coleofasciculaceae cyanobacterium]